MARDVADDVTCNTLALSNRSFDEWPSTPELGRERDQRFASRSTVNFDAANLAR